LSRAPSVDPPQEPPHGPLHGPPHGPASGSSSGHASSYARSSYAAFVLGATALINFAANFVVGRGKFGRLARLAVDGKGGMGDDTIFNAFLIGSLTFFFVFIGARRQARLGRVRGGGSASGVLAFIGRHPIASSIIAGFICAAAVAIPVVRVAKAHGVVTMSGADYVWAKCVFATILSVAVAAVTGFVAVAGEPDVGGDARWCHDPARATVAWPCDYVDKGGLAVTSRAHGCSGTPTWQLLVRCGHGQIDPADARRALADTVARYPQIAARVQSLDGAPPEARTYRYALDPPFTVDDMFACVDLRGAPEKLDAVVAEHLDRHTDPFVDPPLTLTLVQLDGERARLLFRQHHAIADGHAFIDLLADFARFLDDAAEKRRPPPEALAPVARHGELAALGLPPLRRVAWTLAGLGFMLRAAVRARLSPLVPLAQNEGNDYRGGNRTLHLPVDGDTLARWNDARKKHGVSLNSLLTAALMIANQRRQRAHGRRLGRATGALVMETRPRDGSFRSFANHIATLDVEHDLSRPDDVVAVARKLQAQVEPQRARHTPEKRLLAERLLVLALPLANLQRVVFEAKRPAHSFNFSNLIPLPFPTLAGARFTVEEVRITTPVTPRAGILVTVIRYAERALFNFNWKTSAVGEAEVAALRDEFAAVMREATS
jgi:hypothetical protein